jgi:hypothetical protein
MNLILKNKLLRNGKGRIGDFLKRFSIRLLYAALCTTHRAISAFSPVPSKFSARSTSRINCADKMRMNFRIIRGSK